MKKYILMLSIGIAMSSCSSNKKTVTTKFDPANNPYYVKKEQKGLNEVNDPKVQGKINTIIEKHLGISISSIAISPITLTDSGYHWKFMNVRNGKTFTGSTDLKFESVKIIKNNKKTNTQVSDF
ncbi:hypothetical protein D1818_12140 [Aquimarina sp. BL5]|uniref:hypothetical protein n=1 Tax=Aquimarina sp. BL5 TaxID=1714860 RepID=UPI000E4D0CD5|nr:hypothetical protein [Aquimarina sp. BL5]AXT51546.1 hypothetical protein D1818_12140 [Aquimarina sp. BL5]RKN09163.1 hypothetical protein D7036_04855 [Aquimarina sp. BL5]